MNWSQLDTVLEVVNKLKATNSNKDKLAILKSYIGHEDEKMICKVLNYTYDTFKKYGISEQVYDGVNVVSNSIFSDPIEMFDKLSSSNINDLLRLSTKSYIENQVPSEYRELIKGILFKDLKIGVNAKSINKVWKGLVPEFNVQLAESFGKKEIPQGKEFYVTTKIDGCFSALTHITMSDGSFKHIRDVQVGDYVLSFNETTKELSSQRVVNVFNNGKKTKEEWVKLMISCDGDGLGMKKSVSTTKNHKFFTPEGWKQAGDLKKGDRFYSYDYVPSQTQIDVLTGIAFGDGSILFDSKVGRNARFYYAQKEGSLMCDAISSLFENMNGKEKKYTSGYGSKIKAMRIKTIHDLPHAFYNRNNIIKTSFLPNEETLELLSPLALAIWYMDDGSRHHSQEDGENVFNVKTRATLSTYRYPYNSLEKLRVFLEDRYGIVGVLHKYKDTKDGEEFGYQIDFTAEGTDKLFELIAPYILPDKKYKISKKYREVPFIDWTKDCGKIKMVERTLIDIDEDSPLARGSKMEQTAYDLEVENNHTYFANGCAVHNCRILGIPNENGIYSFYTRKGELYEGLDHLQQECQLIGLGIYVLDGELIARNDDNLSSGDLYKVTTKIARKKGYSQDKAKLQFHCFDLIDIVDFKQGKGKLQYHERRGLLESLFHKYADKLINLVNVEVLYQGKDQSQVPLIAKDLEDKGYEGAMINIADAHYECKRHAGVLKVKSFKDADVFVKDVYEGTGRNKGRLGGIVIQYLHNGELHECECGSGFSDEHRIKFWENPELIVGHVIEVQYFEVTQNDKGGYGLRFPTFKNRFRDDKTFDDISDVALQ